MPLYQQQYRSISFFSDQSQMVKPCVSHTAVEGYLAWIKILFGPGIKMCLGDQITDYGTATIHISFYLHASCLRTHQRLLEDVVKCMPNHLGQWFSDSITICLSGRLHLCLVSTCDLGHIWIPGVYEMPEVLIMDVWFWHSVSIWRHGGLIGSFMLQLTAALRPLSWLN